jgi:hypothetical protein
VCAIADALRLRFSPRSCLPRYVPCGRAWRCVSTFLSNRAKTLPSCVGSLWHGFHDAVRVSPSGPHRFSVALLVALPLAWLPKRKGAFELRRSLVLLEIVDGLSEVVGQPLALRVARRRDEGVWAARLDNCGNCLLVSKPAFVSAGQNKSLESQWEGRPPGPTMIHLIFLHSAARPME